MSAIKTATRADCGRLETIPAAALLGAAGAIHLAVAPEHYAEYVPYGVFFVVLGLWQWALAVAVPALRSRRLAGAAAAVNLAVVGLWLASRTTGLPIAPRPWPPERVGAADVAASVCEGVAAAVLLLAVARRPPPISRPWRPLDLANAALATTVAPLLAVAACTSGGQSHGGSASSSGAGQPRTPIQRLVDQPGDEPLRAFTLTARVTTIGGSSLWTYNGTVPGPELRVTQGDRLRVTLVNQLPVSTTIHWHGVAVPNLEDGVAGVTQDAVAPGRSYTYEFVVRQAGTYWYHSHQGAVDQLPKGLFGALVVEPPGGHVAEDREASVILHGLPDFHGVAINGTVGETHLAARPGETVRLRLIDAVAPRQDGAPVSPVLLGAPYRVVSLDGHDLNQPGTLEPERLQLDMGQRADLVFTVPSGHQVLLLDSDGGGLSRGWGAVAVGAGDLPQVGNVERLPVFDPARYGAPAPDGLAEGPFQATYGVSLSDELTVRDGHLANNRLINSHAGPMGAIFSVQPGWLVRLHVHSRSSDWHPMHLHGHVFSVIGWDGQKLRGSPVHQDTVLLPPHRSVDVAFRADNPGLWMFHCHVLTHARDGMTAMVVYPGISTPFQIGTNGNQPE